MPITDWPQAERPREKLLAQGPAALSDAELLAIFLRTGVPGATAVDLARELIQRFGSLRELLAADRSTFCAAAIARLTARCVLPTPGGPSSTTFSLRSTKPSSCKLSTCSRFIEGWNEKSNSASVLTAGNREARIAVGSRRLLRSVIWAPRSRSIASAAVSLPPSASLKTSSTASREPGNFRSASIARICSRRERVGAFMCWLPRAGHTRPTAVARRRSPER